MSFLDILHGREFFSRSWVITSSRGLWQGQLGRTSTSTSDMSSVIGGFGSGPGGDDDGCDSADGSPSPREGSGVPTGLAPSGVPNYMTDTGLRMSVIAKLSPEKLASLNLKSQIAAISLAKSNLRSDREKVAKLLKSIPD